MVVVAGVFAVVSGRYGMKPGGRRRTRVIPPSVLDSAGYGAFFGGRGGGLSIIGYAGTPGRRSSWLVSLCVSEGP